MPYFKELSILTWIKIEATGSDEVTLFDFRETPWSFNLLFSIKKGRLVVKLPNEDVVQTSSNLKFQNVLQFSDELTFFFR